MNHPNWKWWWSLLLKLWPSTKNIIVLYNYLMSFRSDLVFLFFVLSLNFGSIAGGSEISACTDLAKATCDGPWVTRGNLAKESLLNKIKERFQLELQNDKKMAGAKVFAEVEAIHNRTLGKPSKYSDPNVTRPKDLFSLYEKIADLETQKVVGQNQEKIQKLNNLFEKVQSVMIEKIKNEISEPAQTAMIQRLESVKLKNELCTGQFEDAEFYLNRTAFYQTSRHEFAFCPSVFLSEATDAQLTFLIGHELSHSIDPCVSGVTIGHETGKKIPAFINYQTSEPLEYDKRLENYPYSTVLTCLRQEKSSAIKTPQSLDGNPKVTNQFFYDNLCEYDQINEVFCDWMGAEITPVVLKKLHSSMTNAEVREQYATVLSTKCLERRRPTDMHATLERRLNGIIGANPAVRRAMRCEDDLSSAKQYCQTPQNQSSRDTQTTVNEGVR